MSDIAISVRNLVKEYEVYTKPVDLALEVLTRRKRHTIFRALDEVSFNVPRGEVLGIIGSNGAGKSTLLKVITGVLEPSSGTVDIKGRVTAILELGLGFNPEYSGRENIYLSGLLYGMNRAEIDSKLEDIIDFSGLEPFIERPVKTYSSGMHSRLAFSIATAVEPDILIIDEALAAGDSAFVQKCLRRIRHLCSGGRTVLLVSHGTGLLAQLCNQVIWMEHGKVRMMGSAISVVQAYDLYAHQQADSASWIETVDDDLGTPKEPEPPLEQRITEDKTGEAVETPGEMVETSGKAVEEPLAALMTNVNMPALIGTTAELGRQVFRRGPVFIEKVELLDAHGNNTTRLMLLEPFCLKVHYRLEGPTPDESLGVAIAINNKHDLSPVAQFMTQNIRPYESRETYADAADRQRPAAQGTLVLNFDHTPFRKGEYILSLGLLPNDPAIWQFYEYRHFYYPFSVDDAGMDVGAPMLLNPVLTYHVDQPAIASMPHVAPASAPRAMNVTTLREEIDAICLGEGGYPQHWPRHDVCPACNAGPLVEKFAKYGFTHAQCGTCGFVCVNPYPPDAVIGQLYSGHYYSAMREFFERPLLQNSGEGSPYSAPRDVLEDIIDRSTMGRLSGDWLDVGGGLGAFADLVRQKRPQWRVMLNETNPQSIQIAHELFGLDILSDDPETLAASGKRFDVISSVAVLEHIPNPLPFLNSYAALLKPGGWLVTAIPHFSALNAAVSHGSSSNVVPPFHTSLFNEGSFRALLERVPGLEIVSIDQAGPAAFRLIEHMDYGDLWDATIPTAEKPTSQAMQLQPYTDDVRLCLNALDAAGPQMEDYFAKKDGRLYLIAYCRKSL